MIVRVERCWGDKLYFRLTLPGGQRESIGGEIWNRKTAKQALDLLESVYGYNRKKIRFRVR